MNNVDQWIIAAGVVNALLIIALVLMFRNWPRRTSRH
jgi:hypothetical protein